MEETQNNEEKQDLVEESTDESTEDNKDSKVYELGFLIIPSVAEEKLPEVVTKIKDDIEKAGSAFVSEEYPKLLPLTYTIFKSIDHKKQGYDQAYFGWVKFETNPAQMAELKKVFESNSNILRFLIVKTVKESTIYSHKVLVKKSKYTKKTSTESAEEPKEQSSEEEIDKSIDELVAN